MSSFGESKFLALGESEGNLFVKHNAKFLSRTYPGGIRVDSSNYNPQDAWNLGCQIGKHFSEDAMESIFMLASSSFSPHQNP